MERIVRGYSVLYGRGKVGKFETRPRDRILHDAALACVAQGKEGNATRDQSASK